MAKSNSSAAVKPAPAASGKKKHSNFKPHNPGKTKPGGSALNLAVLKPAPKFNPWVCIIAFVIPFMLTLIGYIGFDVFPFGKRSVLTLDLNGQYIYYFEGIRDAFWGDGSLFYNWSRNLSGGFMGIIGYYLASPFTIIPILMPREYILEAIMIMQMCKVGACGLTFYIYAQKSKKLEAMPAVIFSTMYAMMAFVVIQLINPMWIDGPIFLPLIILGVEYLVDDGRKINFIIPTAIMFVANFYIGYMIAIFVAIYFVYYLFFGTSRRFRNIKEYAVTCGVMAISAIVVLLCSLIMILPIYNSLALGKFDFSDPDYDWHKHLFKLPELIPTLLPNQYYSVNVDEGTRFYGRPEIYCGVLTVVLFPLYFFNKDIKWNKKLGAGFLLTVMVLSMYIKPINMYWHGGQDPNWLPYRYSFLLSFILVAMAAEVFANLDGLRLNPRSLLYDIVGKHAAPIVYGSGIFAVISLSALCFSAAQSKYNYNESKYKYVAKGIYYKAEMNYGAERWTEVWLGTLGFGVLLAAAYVVLVFTYASTKKKNIRNFLLVMTACLVCFEGGYNCYDSFRKIYKEVGNSCRESYAEITSAPDDIVKPMEEYDNGFYRSEKTYNRMSNDDMAYGLKGISHSSSVMNARAIKAVEYMGYFTQSFETKYDGSNPVADSLLGIKYIVDAPSRRNNNKKMLDASYVKVPELTGLEYKRYDEPNLEVITDTVDIYKNPNALTIGWMADDDILKIDQLDETNPFNNLNRFMGSMVGDASKEYYKSLPYQVLYDENQVRFHPYTHVNGVVHDCYESYDTSTDAVVNVRFTTPVDGDIYMHLSSQVKKSCNVWVGIKNADGEYTGSNSKNYDGYGQYFETNSSPIVRLGPFTAGQEIEVRFTIPPTNGKYTGSNEYLMVRQDDGFHFCYLDMDEFEKDIAALRDGQWNIDMDKSNDRHLEGTVNVKPGQVFVTSIPYEPGWKIEVDGKEIDDLVLYQDTDSGLKKIVNDDGDLGQIGLLNAFIGIKTDGLEAGEHTISMTYTPPGFNIGVFTLILGIICIILFYIYDRRFNPVIRARLDSKKNAEEPAAEEKAPAKKSVQIIKSKGDVAGDVEEKAKQAQKKAEAEAAELNEKTNALIENYTESAEIPPEQIPEKTSSAAEIPPEDADEQAAEEAQEKASAEVKAEVHKPAEKAVKEKAAKQSAPAPKPKQNNNSKNKSKKKKKK